MTNVALLVYTSLLVALAWTLKVGVDRRDATIVVNAIASIGAVALPELVERLVRVAFEVDASLGTVLPVWIAAAGVLHMLGMLGWYDTIWWWDHVTHLVSAALVAAVVYAWAIVGGVETIPVLSSTRSAVVVALALTMTAGVFWELLEHVARAASRYVGIDPILERYGRLDTPLDLVFDGVGAALVVVFDVRLFVPTFAPIPDVTSVLLYGTTAVLGLGSLVSVLLLMVVRRAS